MVSFLYFQYCVIQIDDDVSNRLKPRCLSFFRLPNGTFYGFQPFEGLFKARFLKTNIHFFLSIFCLAELARQHCPTQKNQTFPRGYHCTVRGLWFPCRHNAAMVPPSLPSPGWQLFKATWQLKLRELNELSY